MLSNWKENHCSLGNQKCPRHIQWIILFQTLGKTQTFCIVKSTQLTQKRDLITNGSCRRIKRLTSGLFPLHILNSSSERLIDTLLLILFRLIKIESHCSHGNQRDLLIHIQLITLCLISVSIMIFNTAKATRKMQKRL